MPAYMIFLCQDISDRAGIETYWSKVHSTLVDYHPNPLTIYGTMEHLEGDEIEGAIVLEFPSMEVAKTWYDSAAYQEIKHYRQDSAKYIGFIVDGGRTSVAERMLSKQ